MAGKIVLAGLKPRPKAKPSQRAALQEKQQEPPELPTCTFLHMDVLELVLAKLGVQDLCRAAGTSREWRAAAAGADTAWRREFVEEFGEEKAVDFANLRTWRDKYIACLLTTTVHCLRSKARYLDELEDSSGLLERNAQTLLAGLNQMDRTLSHRRHDLNALLASVSGKGSTHVDSSLGKQILELASKGGDLQRFPRLTPDVCSAMDDMHRDVEFWKASIAEERTSLHRMWDSLSYIQACTKKARADIGELQQRRAALEQATRYRPNVRRT